MSSPIAAPGSVTHNTSATATRAEVELRVFTRRAHGPRPTFSLVLASVTVAALSMSLDAVPRYSHDAFFAGIVLTAILAFFVGTLADMTKGLRVRLPVTLGLPTLFGAFIGVVVQTLVLKDVGPSWAGAVKDLDGLVDTTEPGPWIASGVVLGGVPALAVSVFLILASRSIRRLTGHDASEGFGVVFTGFTGVLAAFGLVWVDSIAAPPLLFVAVASGLTLLVATLVDGSRVRLLRRVYAGQGEGLDIVPAERFANDPSLAPMVANAGADSVLVRMDGRVGSYRAAAAEPIAFVGPSEQATLQPLLRRRAAATTMLVAMVVLSALATFAHV